MSEEYDPIEETFAIGYSETVVEDFYNVLKMKMQDGVICYDAIAEKLNLSESYVHLISELMANADVLEYGTSPRCGWLTDKGKELYRLATEYRDKK